MATFNLTKDLGGVDKARKARDARRSPSKATKKTPAKSGKAKAVKDDAE